MLTVRQLNAGYGKFQVIFDLDLEVNPGEIFLILGPNGSGKTTLLKSIAGLTSLYSGRIIYDGMDIAQLSAPERVRRGIVYLHQTEKVFTDLSVRENLKMSGYILNEREIEERMDIAIGLLPELTNLIEKKANELSGGEIQILALAMALVRKSRLLLLDEPTANLAPKLAEDFMQKILELRDRLGVTMIIVEQNQKRPLKVSDRVCLLHSGKIGYQSDEPDKLLDHPELDKIFFGLHEAE